MAVETAGSVTDWVGPLKRGVHAAAQPLWERSFERLVRLARGKLAGGRNLADEEDVALSAFDSFCRAAAGGRFPVLEDRDDLWKLLVSFAARRALNSRKHAVRRKRGAGRVLDQAALSAPNLPDDLAGLEAVPGSAPTPELAAEVAEACRVLLDLLDREDPTHVLGRSPSGSWKGIPTEKSRTGSIAPCGPWRTDWG